ncbi:MAG: hypothetical protein AAGE96_25425 [Cyanobacteria bacterium P01_G01_bin.19]
MRKYLRCNFWWFLAIAGVWGLVVVGSAEAEIASSFSLPNTESSPPAPQVWGEQVLKVPRSRGI